MPRHADELSLLQAQMVYKKRLEAMMAELRSQEAPLLRKVTELERIKDLEQKDLARLEGRSLAVFFYSVTGKMDEKLDKERREAYAARVKYDAARRELDAIQEDIRETEEDLKDLWDCEQRYAQTLALARQAIADSHTSDGEIILEKERCLQQLKGQEQELEEAISAGTDCLQIISRVLDDLNTAKDWSYFDVLGGGLLSDIAKHDHLDEAQQNIESLQVQLQRFNKELSDVSVRSELQVSIDRMLKFADFFFDGLLTDLTVLDHIRHAYNQAEQTKEQILSILRHLQTTLEQVREDQNSLNRELDALVLSTLT